MAKSNAPRLEIDISVTGVAKSAKDFGTLHKQLQDTEQEFKKANRTALELEGELKSLSSSLNSGSISQAKFNSEQKGVRTALASARQSAQQYQARINSLNATIAQGANVGRSYGEEVKRLQGVHNSFASGMRSSNAVAIEFSRIIQDAPYGMQGIANNLQQLTQNYAYYAESVRKSALEQGKSIGTMGILRGAIGGLFSPLNLLTLGVSAVTAGWVMYEKWQQKANKATKEAKQVLTPYIDSLNGVAKAHADGQVNAQKELVTIEQLYKATQNTDLPMKTRIENAKELIKQGGELFKSTSAEAVVAGQASEAYDRLTASIQATAMAQAYMQRMTENASKVLSNNLDVVSEANEIMKLNQQIAKQQSMTTIGKATGAVGESVESSNISILNKLYEEREQRVKRINELNKDNSETLKEQNLLQNGINTQLEKGAKITSGVGGEGKKKGKTQAELIKEANEALATGQIRALEGIDGEMAKIDAKWDSINEKINKITDSALKKQKLGLSAIGRETEKYNKFLEIFAKSPLTESRGDLPRTTSGVLNTPSSLPNLSWNQWGINNRRRTPSFTSEQLGDDFSKQFQSTLRRGLSSIFNDLFSDITTMSQENYSIEKKYANLRKEATQSQIEGLNRMESLERKINNGLTNMISKIGTSFVGIGGNMLSSALSTGISSGNFSDLSNMFKKGNKAVGYGALGSLAGGLIQGVSSPTNSAGQIFGGLLGGAGTGAAIGSTVMPGIGTAVGAVVGAITGAISGIFSANKARRQEKLAEEQLNEQKKLVALQERQMALAYASSVIGQKTNQGIVTGVERNEFGDLVSRVKGSDLELVIERSKSSR